MRFAIAALLLLVAAQALAADPDGKQLFRRYCAECHDPGFGHPGTQMLEQLRGKSLSILEQRTDLKPEYIEFVVRHGLWEMPAYRPAEIDDAQLAQLARYLTSPKSPLPAHKN